MSKLSEGKGFNRLELDLAIGDGPIRCRRGLKSFSAAFQKLPPTDGVVWVKTDRGIFAQKVTRGLAGSRAGISVGDRLIGIGFDGEKTDEITSVADVQMYLETAGVNGNLTYFYQKPSYTLFRQLLLRRSEAHR